MGDPPRENEKEKEKEEKKKALAAQFKKGIADKFTERYIQQLDSASSASSTSFTSPPSTPSSPALSTSSTSTSSTPRQETKRSNQLTAESTPIRLRDFATKILDMQAYFYGLPPKAKHDPSAAAEYIKALNQYLSHLNELQEQRADEKEKATKEEADTIVMLYGIIGELSGEFEKWHEQALKHQAGAEKQGAGAPELKKPGAGAAELKKPGGAGATEKTPAEAETKRQAEAELIKARDALDKAMDTWESRLETAKAEVEKLENKKPATGLYAQQNPDESEEGINANLANKRKQVLYLETQIEDAKTWGPDEMLSWYRNTQGESARQTAEKKKRLPANPVELLNFSGVKDPTGQLAGALAQLRDAGNDAGGHQKPDEGRKAMTISSAGKAVKALLDGASLPQSSHTKRIYDSVELVVTSAYQAGYRIDDAGVQHALMQATAMYASSAFDSDSGERDQDAKSLRGLYGDQTGGPKIKS